MHPNVCEADTHDFGCRRCRCMLPTWAHQHVTRDASPVFELKSFRRKPLGTGFSTLSIQKSCQLSTIFEGNSVDNYQMKPIVDVNGAFVWEVNQKHQNASANQGWRPANQSEEADGTAPNCRRQHQDRWVGPEFLTLCRQGDGLHGMPSD